MPANTPGIFICLLNKFLRKLWYYTRQDGHGIVFYGFHGYFKTRP